VADISNNGDDVIDDDDDADNGTNFDKVVNVADMLDEALGLAGKESDNESDNDEMLWGEWGEA
jgi:hypothetical protein